MLARRGNAAVLIKTHSSAAISMISSPATIRISRRNDHRRMFNRFLARIPKPLCDKHASMTTDELKACDNNAIAFAHDGKSMTGTLNYLTAEERFQIIYFKPEHGGGANQVLDLTNEMIERIE